MTSTIDKTISKVVESGLCTGCGTCAGICPQQCIAMIEDTSKGIYLPHLELEKCNECGICLKACPGHEVDFRALNLEIFGTGPTDSFVGNYINSYVGHSTDYDLRYNSASGGLVTALLIFALEEGIIDGALITKMDDGNPLRPHPFIARTKDEIISAAKSKYCPVPLNIGLKEILQEDGKFAIVGLPCHIHGIRKAETIMSSLKSKIVLHLGLYCNHTPSFLATQYILQKVKVRPEEVAKLEYRAEGWPFTMRIILRSGKQLLLPNYWGNGFGFFFYPECCLMCLDKSSELSDCSFADAWLPELAYDRLGSSMVICRSAIGAKLLEDARQLNLIKLKEIPKSKMVKAQGLIYRRKAATAVMSVRNLFNKQVPAFNVVPIDIKITSQLTAIKRYICMNIGRRRRLWVFITLFSSVRTLLISLIRRFRRGTA